MHGILQFQQFPPRKTIMLYMTREASIPHTMAYTKTVATIQKHYAYMDDCLFNIELIHLKQGGLTYIQVSMNSPGILILHASIQAPRNRNYKGAYRTFSAHFYTEACI